MSVFDHVVVVVGPDMPDLVKAVQPHVHVVQEERLGTGHAARMAEAFLAMATLRSCMPTILLSQPIPCAVYLRAGVRGTLALRCLR